MSVHKELDKTEKLTTCSPAYHISCKLAPSKFPYLQIPVQPVSSTHPQEMFPEKYNATFIVEVKVYMTKRHMVTVRLKTENKSDNLP